MHVIHTCLQLKANYGILMSLDCVWVYLHIVKYQVIEKHFRFSYQGKD